MGEFVVNSEDVEEVKVQEKAEDGGWTGERTRRKEGISMRMAELAKFLPRMALRVMLVESDDSTRQIVSALLRKCSYKVASVPDGLKAWEILKDKAHNIDLILTEVDFPSISGFALLTLIMEHDICKHIPVIMMSSQDSISTVYKCMMRGAADYLVKPVRRNELRNLWRHVWRKETSIISGSLPQDESVGQQRLEDEATSKNDPASNHASGSMACVQRNEKGNDDQSSCTRPNLQAEKAHMENMQEHPPLKRGESLLVESEKHGAFANYSEKPLKHKSKSGVLVEGSCDNGYTTNVSEGVEAKRQRRDATGSSEACDTVAETSIEAIDFMTTFNSENFTLDNVTNKVDSHSGLDLTLRSHPESHFNQERRTLWHPNASAFTRYAIRPPYTPDPTSIGVSNQQKEFGTNYERSMSNVIVTSNSDTPSPTLTTPRSTVSLSIGQSKRTEVAEPCPQKGFFPAPVQVRGNYSIFPLIYCPQATVVSRVSTASNQHDHAFHVNPCNKSQQLYDRLFPNPQNSGKQAMQKQDNLSSFEDRGHTSWHTSATDQSGSSRLGNGARSHFIGYGNTCASNGNGNQGAVINVSIESMKENGSGNSHRFGQREAALNKFRLKRKDRCFEKKVRYESRKKLAEQRPRIKGQFVRQMQPDTQHKETQHQSDG